MLVCAARGARPECVHVELSAPKKKDCALRCYAGVSVHFGSASGTLVPRVVVAGYSTGFTLRSSHVRGVDVEMRVETCVRASVVVRDAVLCQKSRNTPLATH